MEFKNYPQTFWDNRYFQIFTVEYQYDIELFLEELQEEDKYFNAADFMAYAVKRLGL